MGSAAAFKWVSRAPLSRSYIVQPSPSTAHTELKRLTRASALSCRCPWVIRRNIQIRKGIAIAPLIVRDGAVFERGPGYLDCDLTALLNWLAEVTRTPVEVMARLGNGPHGHRAQEEQPRYDCKEPTAKGGTLGAFEHVQDIHFGNHPQHVKHILNHTAPPISHQRAASHGAL